MPDLGQSGLPPLSCSPHTSDSPLAPHWSDLRFCLLALFPQITVSRDNKLHRLGSSCNACFIRAVASEGCHGSCNACSVQTHLADERPIWLELQYDN